VFSQFHRAEMMAEKYGLSKDQLDEYSYHSHQPCHSRHASGKIQGRDHPLQITRADGSTDTHTSMKASVRCQPRGHPQRQADRENGKLTPAQRQPDLRRRLGRDGRHEKPKGSGSSRWPRIHP